MHTARCKPHVISLYTELEYAKERLVSDDHSAESKRLSQVALEAYNAAFTAARAVEFAAEGLTLADMLRIYLARLDSD